MLATMYMYEASILKTKCTLAWLGLASARVANPHGGGVPPSVAVTGCPETDMLLLPACVSGFVLPTWRPSSTPSLRLTAVRASAVEEKIVDVAIAAGREAADVVVARVGADVLKTKASRGDLLTAADAEVQDLIERRVAEALIFTVGQGLSRRDGDGVTRVDSHRVKVLDAADNDDVVGAVAHHL